MLALRDLPFGDVKAWADRLTMLESAEDFDGREMNISIARDVIAAQRRAGLITDTPENSRTGAPSVPPAPVPAQTA